MPTTPAATPAIPQLSVRPCVQPASDLASHAGEDAALEEAIFKLLAQRQSGASICPSDAARAVYPDTAQWRAAMPKVRALAAQLADTGRLVVTQRGVPVNVRAAVGPVRLRLGADFG